MFTLADQRKHDADAASPPRWKTMVASALAIYPLIYFVLPALKPYTDALPAWAAVLAQAAVLTPMSTLIMIPAVTWMLKRWLYRLRAP